MAEQISRLGLAVDSQKAKADVKVFREELQKTGEESIRAENKLKKTEKSVKDIGATAATSSINLRRLLGGFSAFLTIRNVINTIAQFEDRMSKVQSVSRATATEMKALTAAARELGKNTRFTASQAADGLILLSQAGLSAKQSLEAIPAVLDLASAGSIDLATSADIVAKTLSQFSLASSEASRVADVFSLTANSANTNVTQLGEAMAYTGPVAANLKVSLEETAAAIAVLSNAGIQASTAGTGLRGTFADLLNPTSEAIEVINQLGLTLDDVDPRKKGLIGSMRAFAAAGLEAGDSVKIFGVRNAVAALVLAKNAEQVDAYTQSLNKAGGSAKEAAKINEDNLAGSFRTLKSAIEEISYVLGDAGLAKGVRRSTEALTSAIKILFGFAKASDESNRTAQILASTLKLVGVLLGGLVVKSVITFFINLGLAVQRAVVGFTALRAAIIANPIGLFASTVAAAAASLFLLSSNAGASTNAIIELTEAEKQLKTTFDDLDKSQTRFARFQELKDLQSQYGEISSVINSLTKRSEQLREEISKAPDQARVSYEEFAGTLRRVSDFLGKDLTGSLPFGALSGSLPAGTQVKSLERLIGLLQKQSDVLRGRAEAARFDAETEIKSAIAREKSSQAISKTIEELKLEAFLIGKSEDVKKNTLILAKAEADLLALGNEERAKQIRQIADLVKVIGERNAEEDRKKEDAANARKSAEANAHAAAAILDYVEAQKELVRLTGLSDVEREKSIALSQAEQLLKGTDVKLTEEQSDAIKKYTEDRLRLQKILDDNADRARKDEADRIKKAEDAIQARDDARSAVEQTLHDLSTELELINLSNDARDQEIQRRQFLIELTKAQASDTESLISTYDQLIERINKVNKEKETTKKKEDELKSKTDELAQGGADVVTGFVEAIIDGTQSITDNLQDAAREIEKLFLEEFALKPLNSLLKTLFQSFASSLVPQAHGGAVDASRHIIPMASGRIVNTPELSPLANGKTRLVAEAGPEAVLPLVRVGNDLGVKADLGDQGPNTRVLQFRQTVVTKDADSFRRAGSQIYADFRRYAQGGNSDGI